MAADAERRTMMFEKVESLRTYEAHVEAGVMLKTVVDGRNKMTLYAMGNDVPDFFECRIDSHGNVCDVAGIVVFPSRSGKHPAKRGDTGYFGDFAENFGTRDAHPELPSVDDDVYSTMTVRDLLAKHRLTQTDLAKRFNIPLRTVQNWAGGVNTPPPYLVPMMDELLTRK